MAPTSQTAVVLPLRQVEIPDQGLYDRFPAMVHVVDRSWRLVSVSDRWLDALGYCREEVLGRRSLDFLTDASRRHVVDHALPTLLRTGRCQDLPLQLTRRDGAVIEVLLSATVERDASGRLLRAVAILADVGELRKAEHAARPSEESKQQLRDFLDTATDWLWKSGPDHRISCLTDGHAKTDVPNDWILGKTRWELADVDPATDEQWAAHLADLEAHRPFRNFRFSFVGPDDERHYRSSGGNPIFDANGNFEGYRGTARDITSCKKAEMAIQHMALYDSLTSLPNRIHFNKELERACEIAQRDDSSIAVLFLDLDHFKDINDTLGHSIGDQVLVEVARRLKSCVRTGDLVARLGGDEFAIIATDQGEPKACDDLANRIIKTIGEPIRLDELTVRMGISAGITIYPDGDKAEQVLAKSHMALHAAKTDGRETWRMFDRHMHQIVCARRTLDQDLRKALEQQEFELHYQPLIDMANNEVRSFEALLRWNHPERGRLLPNSFIPAAERSQLIIPLTEWVLREALAQWHRWANTDLGRFKIAINVSPIVFKVDGFADLVARCLAANGCDPRHFGIEITESSLIEETKAVPVLDALRELGVTIAIDDFGTAYSSMSRLRNLPIDTLKIDRSFLTNITDQEDAANIAESLVRVGRSLEKLVVAEGVEMIGQLEFLAKVGCHQAQGFLLARPMAAAAVPTWIEGWQRLHIHEHESDLVG